MGQTNQISSIFWLIIGLAVTYRPYQLDLGTLIHPEPGFLSFWCGLIPRDVFKQATNDPAFQQVMERIFIPVEYSSADEFRRRLEEDYKQNEKLILELGLHKSQKK